MSLAKRILQARERAELTLDQLADRAGVSKTYLWELENDKKGTKKPSADVLLKIARALSVTIAELLELPQLRGGEQNILPNPALVEFSKWMKTANNQPLSDDDLRELASIRFRGGQPTTREEWYDLYRVLKRATGE